PEGADGRLVARRAAPDAPGDVAPDGLALALSVARRPAGTPHQVAVEVVEVGPYLDHCLTERLRHPGSPSSCWSAARSGRAVGVLGQSTARPWRGPGSSCSRGGRLRRGVWL